MMPKDGEPATKNVKKVACGSKCGNRVKKERDRFNGELRLTQYTRES